MKISDSVLISFLLSGFIDPLDTCALKAASISLVNTQKIELSESTSRAGCVKSELLGKIFSDLSTQKRGGYKPSLDSYYIHSE